MAESNFRSDAFLPRPPASWELYAYGFVRTLVNLLNHIAWRVEVKGSEKIPTGPCIIAPVHRSYIDTLLIASLTTRRLRYMGKDGVWKHKPVAVILNALGGFPVHRGITDRDAMRRCIDVLRGGEPLVLFPEGTRKEGPKVDQIFEGAAYLGAKANAPIVPVGIGGSERAWGKSNRFPRFSRVTLVVGDPIFPKLSSSGEAPSRVTRSLLLETTRQLTQSLQQLFEEAQGTAGESI